MEHIKIPTSAEVYAVIWAKHRHQLAPFTSFSDPDGTFMGSPGEQGRMDTEYGISGDFPIVGISTTWPIIRNADGVAREGEKKQSYWLCVVVES